MSTVHQPPTRVETPSRDATDVRQLPLHEVCRHIERCYHRPLRGDLPRLSLLVARVERRHSMDDHRLDEARNVFERLRAELEAHMTKEERLLFPLCQELEFGRRTAPLQAPLTMLEREHGEVRAALARLRHLTDGFAVDGARCESHRRLLVELATLADETIGHLDAEQRVLFPRALALADR
jgi:regulator of cell morphogenesis and NO signaling